MITLTYNDEIITSESSHSQAIKDVGIIIHASVKELENIYPEDSIEIRMEFSHKGNKMNWGVIKKSTYSSYPLLIDTKILSIENGKKKILSALYEGLLSLEANEINKTSERMSYINNNLLKR